MALYKLCLIRDGELAGEIQRNFAEDLDALDAARALARDHVVEVYTETRLVARVKLHDEALNVRDAHSG